MLSLSQRRVHSVEIARTDPAARPVAQRLRGFGRTQGLVWGAFGEASREVHTLLAATAKAAATSFWREAGATSALTAEASYTAFYRREWGCESVWGHARVRVARIEYVTGGAPAPAAMGAGGFDPADHATFAQATAFRFGGPPRGQAR